MKKISAYILITVCLLGILSSCDKIERPYRQSYQVSCADTNARKILIEDYTGHFCGNCPLAAAELYNHLEPLYGECLISIGVHASAAGTFTAPSPPHAYPDPYASAHAAYSEDFRTPAGEEWYSFFNFTGNPQG